MCVLNRYFKTLFPCSCVGCITRKVSFTVLTNGIKLGVLTQNIEFVRQINVKMYRLGNTIMYKVANGRVLDL